MSGSQFDLLILWVAAVGQVLFVVLWLTQRWWASTVGQALMVKGLSLALILATSVYAYYHPVAIEVWRAMFAFVALGCVGQFLALGIEIYRARRDSRPVAGTTHHPKP